MMRGSDLGSLRRWLVGRLGEPLPDVVWEDLVEHEYAITGVADDPAQVEALEGEARRLLRISKSGRPQRRSPRPRTSSDDPGESPLIQARDRALTVLLAEHAEARVRSFREECLPKGLLQQDEMDAWLGERNDAEGPPQVYTGNDPMFVHSEPRAAPLKFMDFNTFPVSVPGSGRVLLPGPGTFWYQAEQRTTLVRLSYLTDLLAQEYPWAKEDALRFVLTGEPPPVQSWIATIWLAGIREWPMLSDAGKESAFIREMPPSVTSRITLTLDPTLTPKQVARVYRDARRRLLQRDARALSVKHCELAAFTAGRRPGSLGDQMADWNTEHPDWAYDDPRNFSRDAGTARDRLLHLPIAWERFWPGGAQ